MSRVVFAVQSSQSASTFDVDTSMDVDSETTETHPTTSAASITSSSAASASDVRPAVQQREIKLTSVLQLRNTIENDMHSGNATTTGWHWKKQTMGLLVRSAKEFAR